MVLCLLTMSWNLQVENINNLVYLNVQSITKSWVASILKNMYIYLEIFPVGEVGKLNDRYFCYVNKIL